MKCDKLKPLVFSISDLAYVDEPTPQPNFQNPHDHAVYKATEVDAAIAELKDKCQMHDFFWEGCGFAKRGFKNTIAVSEAFDRLEAENRKLKHALWLARAELCRRLDVDRYLRNHCNSWYNENFLTWDEACVAMEVKMCKAESKCQAKAEEYK